ncbi:hypothetical protein JCM18901_1171 [Psychrobacter sp. JCM 18901]|nr:hypothetical protein JCM18901_1171 [Psychrobacter sp. JCM 18901]
MNNELIAYLKMLWYSQYALMKSKNSSDTFLPTALLLSSCLFQNTNAPIMPIKAA